MTTINEDTARSVVQGICSNSRAASIARARTLRSEIAQLFADAERWNSLDRFRGLAWRFCACGLHVGGLRFGRFPTSTSDRQTGGRSHPSVGKQFLRATGCGIVADKRRANIEAAAGSSSGGRVDRLLYRAPFNSEAASMLVNAQW